jgi:hypothetical protein
MSHLIWEHDTWHQEPDMAALEYEEKVVALGGN